MGYKYYQIGSTFAVWADIRENLIFAQFLQRIKKTPKKDCGELEVKSMDFLTAIGAKISECAVELVCRQLGYSFHYKTNLANLKTKIQHLEDEMQRVQHSIDERLEEGTRKLKLMFKIG